MMLNKQKIAKAVNAVSVCVLAFFGLVLLYFGTRVFVCDKYPVSTTSMTPTIIPGDQILVNKLVFGARIYKNLKFLQAIRSKRSGFPDSGKSGTTTSSFSISRSGTTTGKRSSFGSTGSLPNAVSVCRAIRSLS